MEKSMRKIKAQLKLLLLLTVCVSFANAEETCTDPEAPVNGKVSVSGVFAAFTCDKGYELNGTNYLTCEENNTWSGEPPTCGVVNCGSPPEPTNGNATYTQTTYSSVATFNCDRGYNLSGPASATCKAKGTWSNNGPNCIIVDCGEPSAPSNGSVTFNATTYSATIDYYCDTGYNSSSNDTQDVCEETGNWRDGPPTCTIVDCGSPGQPSNGGTNYIETTYLSQADYYCNTGYELSGANTSSCLDTGSWSNSAPVCNIVDCGTDPVPTNGYTINTLNSTTYLSEIEYHCNIGYDMDGPLNASCLDNGSWSDNPPTCNIVDCGNLTAPVNGDVTLSDTVYNSTASYTCDIGYNITGETETRDCDATGNWTLTAPTCVIVDCGEPSAPSNGSVTFNATTYSATIDYYCDIGYTFSRNDTQDVCEETGNWRDGPPTCTIVDCGNLTAPVNGDVTLTDTVYNSIASYTCDIGYNITGETSTRDCDATGNWTLTAPTCVIVDCGNLTAPVNGDVTLSDTVYNSTASYTCDIGYNITGETETRDCDATGNWTLTAPTCVIVDCGEPSAPSNGSVTFNATTYSATIDYYCDIGYTFSRNDTQDVCEETGNWRDGPPTCTIVDCGNLTAPVNGDVTLTDTVYNSIASYTCDIGYNITGETSTRDCDATGNWTLTAPTCVIVDCGNLTAPVNGDVSISDIVYNSTAYYTCDIGYNITGGSTSRDCDDTGQWTLTAPTCVIVDCGSPEEPSNGGTTYTNTTYLSQVDYYCDTGYELSGANSSSCLETGFWNNSVPTCIIVDCGTEPVPTNGYTNNTLNSTTYLSEIEYHCDIGYDTDGPLNASCLDNGSWSDNPPTCNIVDCGNVTSPADGFIFQSDTVYQAVVSYTCDIGYNLVGEYNVRFCDEYGNWTGTAPTCDIVDCSIPEEPSNGGTTYTNTTYLSQVDYYCDTGYELSGVNNASCLETGSWSDSVPVCNIVDCGNLTAPVNGDVSFSATVYNSTASYTCDIGYDITGETETRDCDATGNWTLTAPTCVIVDCGNLTAPVNGDVTLNDTIYNSTASYTCDIGYNITGETETRDCDATGNWTLTAPTCVIVDCGIPEEPSNGGTTYTNTTYLSQVDYYCDTGYELSGVNNASCLETGSWSDSVPVCNIVDCGNLTAPVNGDVSFSATVYNSTASYTCDIGYDITGETETRDCDATGNWTLTAPTCVIVDCGNLTAPVNGDVTLTDTVYNSTASYTCDIGYNITGETETRDCDATGNWTLTAPTCVIVDCGIPEEPSNGGTTYTNTTYLSQVDYYCDTGYELSGVNNASCLETGSWSDSVPVCNIVDCGNLTAPVNGDVSFSATVYNSTASYTCDIGYDITGETETRDCDATGNWTLTAPTCVIVDCGNLTAPVNGDVTLTDTVYNSTASYTCDIGYNITGETETRDCDATGNWTLTAPTCVIVDCGIPEEPSNGGTTYTNTTYLSQVDYYCDTGYELSGVNNASCLETGSWSDSVPVCNIVDCGNLTAPVNGDVSFNDTVYNSTAYYTCDIGYDITGETETRDCDATGNWTLTAPTCVIFDCGNLTAPVNGDVTLTDTVYNSTASYTCDIGYNITGETETRDCGATGNWTLTAPTCVIVDCKNLTDPENGTVNTDDGTTYGSTAVYSCNTGYNMTTGDEVRTCDSNGSWNGTEPQCLIVDCGEPIAPTNGNVTFSDTTYNSTIEYSCDVGHHLNVSYNATCEESGSWSTGTNLSCIIADCGPTADNITNGNVTQTGTEYNEVSIYICDPGYMISTGNLSLILTCDADGYWDNEVPSCIDIDCGELRKPLNGQVNTDLGTGYNDVASYTCDDGYKLSGRNIRTCTSDALWDGVAPVCDMIDCGNLTQPANGTVNMTGTNYLHVAVYWCSQGFELVNGTETRTCNEDEIWNGTEPSCQRKVCPELTNITNGALEMTGNVYEDVANYSCVEGYFIEPGVIMLSLFCNASGMWDEDIPECVPVDCGELSPPDNGQVNYHNTSFGMIAAYTCDHGYRTYDNYTNYRTCDLDGLWTESPLKCFKKDCGSLSSPDNGNVVFNLTEFEEMAVYNCSTGYEMISGSSTVICTEDGTWNDTQPVCELWDCGSPGNLTNGVVSLLNGTLYEDIALFECNLGYVINGTLENISMSFCLEGGVWSDQLPTCEYVDCGILDNPFNGEVELINGTGLHSVASYTCYPWYKISGSEYRTCLANSEWSEYEPLCVPVLPPRNTDCGFRNEDILIGLGISSKTTAVEFGIMKDMVKFHLRRSENVNIGLFTFSHIGFYSIPIREYQNKDDFYSAVDDLPFNASTFTPSLDYAFFYIHSAMENGEFHNESRDVFRDYVHLILDEYTAVSNYQYKRDVIRSVGVELLYMTIGLSDGELSSMDENEENEEVDSYSELFLVSQSMWSLEDSCDCGLQYPPVNGDVTVTGSYFMDTALFTCDDGYKLEGSNNMTCLYGGIWSDFPPSCIPVNEDFPTPRQSRFCGIIDMDIIIAMSVSDHRSQYDIVLYKQFIEALLRSTAMEEGLVNVYFFTFDSYVSPVINSMYHSPEDIYDAVDNIATNNSSGSASLDTALVQIDDILEEMPTYRRNKDVLVMVVMDTSVLVTGNETFLNSQNVTLWITTIGISLYAPELNYLLFLTQFITPMLDTSYLHQLVNYGTNDICYCVEISDPENGYVMFNGTIFLNKALFECDEGYELVGYEEIRCQLGGFWSRPPPSCIPKFDMDYLDIDCGFGRVDVIVAVGVSSSLSEEEFNIMQGKVSQIVGRSAIDEHITQMGYFVFDEEVHQDSVIELNEIKNREDMLAAINETSYTSTFTSALLHVAGKQIIEMLANSRVRDPGLPVVVVILVDGSVDESEAEIFFEDLDILVTRVIIDAIGFDMYHEVDFNNTFMETNKTDIKFYQSFDIFNSTEVFDTEYCGCSAIDLWNGSVSLSGTDYLDTASLVCHPGFTLVGPEELVCLLNGFWSDSLYNSGNIALPYCDLIGVPPSIENICGYRDIDIIFAFGMSSFIDESDFIVMKNVAKQVIGVSDIDSGSVRIAFIVFDTQMLLQTSLDDPLMSRSYLHGVLDNMKYQPSLANMSILSVGWESALTVFSSDGNNTSTPNLLVMIVDSNVNIEDSRYNMTLAKKTGLDIDIIAVGMNNGTELHDLALTTEYSSFTDLQTDTARWYHDPTCYCPDIDNLTNGTVIMEGQYLLDTASFSCDEGYDLVGDREVQCMYDGQWSAEIPVCTPKAPSKTMDLVLRLNISTTPDLNNNETYNAYMEAVRIALEEHYGNWMKNGSVEISIKFLSTGSLIVSFTVNVTNNVESAETFAQATSNLSSEGSTITVLNDTLSTVELLFGEDSVDLSTIDIQQATCLTFEEINGQCDIGYICGMVNDTVPSCLPDPNTDCGYPGSFLFGYFDIANGTTLGKTAEYSCNVGYILDGNTTRHCGINGKWQPEAPTCNPVDCGNLTTPLNGYIASSQGTTFGQLTMFACDFGFTGIGTDTLRCLENGNWSAEVPSCEIIPDYCGNVSTLENGAMSFSNGSQIDSVVTFECNLGYTLFGSTTKVCSNTANWEPQINTTCLINDCGSLEAPENGFININETTYGEVASFKCQPQFVLAGERSLTCTHHGNWSADVPTCYLLSEFCGLLLDPQHGRQTVLATSPTELEAVFVCNTGYKLVGPETRTCSSANGTWIPDEASTCELKDCGPLFNPENGNVDQSAGTTYGQVVYYSCSAGYQLLGDEQAVCNADGQWSNPPICQVTNCGGLPHPENGQVTAETTTFGQMAVYRCNNGYDITGVTRRICLTDGSWSGKEPDCYPKDCGSLFAPIHGEIDMSEGTLYGSTVYYTCDDGYELNGAEQTTCSESGIWQPARSPKCNPTLCPVLSHPDNGMVELSEGISYGSVATYFCNIGYELSGSATKLCTADTIWYPTLEVTCDAIDCGRLPKLSNGNVIYEANETTYGNSASFSCNHGYILSVSSLFTTLCMEDGNWDLRTMPTCTLVDCGRPPVIMNGNRVYKTTTFDSTAVYKCHVGYEMDSDDRIKCMASGSWSTAPSCDRIDCGDLKAPEFGSVVFTDGTLYKSGATFTCQTGYEMTGPEMKICSSNKKWQPAENPTCTILDCGNIPHPDKGFVEISFGTTYGQTAIFRCNVGFDIFGATQVLCTNTGDWSAQPPICQATDCGGLENPENGIVTSQQTTLSQRAIYECNPGYTLQGTSVRICQASGSWSGTLPKCKPKDCGKLEAPKMGDIVYNSDTLYGSTVEYQCNNGYIINGISTRTCLHTGDWSDVAPTCDKVDCGERPILENGDITDSSSNTLFGAEVIYECDIGYKIIGSNIARCLDTAQWSPLPTCRLRDCGSLVHPPYGEVIVQGQQFGDSALYQCNVGYEMIGVPTRQCKSNGEWSGIPPLCKIVDCGEIEPPENGFIELSSGTEYKSFVVFDCDPLHQKTGPSAVVCRADGQWSNKETTCTLIDGYVSEKLTLHLNMSVEAAVDFDNDTVYRSYQSEVKNQLLLHYITEMAQSNINVIVKSLSVGSLIVSYTVTIPDTDVSKQKYSTATQSLAHGSVVTVFDEPLTTTRMEIGDDNVNIVELPSDEVICQLFIQICGSCEPSHICIVESGVPQCRPDPSIDCGTPPRPVNGYIDISDGTLLNAVVEYNCNLGYTLIGDDTLTCQLTGQWKPSAPNCIRTDCGDVVAPSDGSIVITSTTYGSTASFTCNTDYSLIGVSSIICQADGTWSNDPPRCQITGCGDLSEPDNGKIEVIDNGLTAVYTCNVGYILNGDSFRRCIPHVAWSGVSPTCQHIVCGDLSPPTNGMVLYSSTLYGSTATYICTKEGYELNGLQSRTCGEEGLWSGDAPTCDLKDCGQLLPISHGNLELTGTTYNNTGTYSCKQDYILQGSHILTCLISGWSDTPPVCILSGNCGTLENPLNGYVTLSGGSKLGSEATYACYNGYRLSEDNIRTCLYNNTWSGSKPLCNLIDCGQVEVPAGGAIDTITGTTYSERVNFTCNIGYNIFGPSYTVCQNDGTWSDTPICRIKDCGGLSHPIGGGVDTLAGTTFGSTATYICNTGYYMQGSSIRLCTESGDWESSPPTCQLKDCGDLPSPVDGTVIYSAGTTYGQIATFRCNTGFSMSGSPTLQCNEDGNWDGSPPICVPIVCSTLSNPVNGRVIYSIGRGVGSIATYICDTNYMLTPSHQNKTCLNNGSWSNNVIPSCVYVDCGVLEAPTFGDVTVNISTRTATYICNPGYMLSGTGIRRCDNNDEWIGLTPICTETDCGPLNNPLNGIVTMATGNGYRSVAVYECDAGYMLDGYYKRTCQSNGTWTGEDIHCKSSSEYTLAIGLGVGITGFVVLVVITVLIVVILYRRETNSRRRKLPRRSDLILSSVSTLPRKVCTKPTIYLPYGASTLGDEGSDLTEFRPTLRSGVAEYDNNPFFYGYNLPGDDLVTYYPQ